MYTKIAMILACYFACVSLITFFMFGIDKRKAVKKKWRIQEKTLLLWAFFGGSFGAMLGMILFHHKIRKPKFYLTVPIFMILHCVMLFFLLRSGRFSIL